MDDKLLQSIIKSKQYIWYDDGRLNLIGIRSKNRRANKFDDWFTITFYLDKSYKTYLYPCTTDPGSYWLNNLLNPRGCAILVPGQYKDVYSLALHRNKYEALCQRLGSVKVYRDKNKDNQLDIDKNTIQEGMFGINIHHASLKGITEWVDMYSAGCQVFQNIDDFYHARNLWRTSSKIFGNCFTYTLLQEEDFE
jgi:hypothetical protein